MDRMQILQVFHKRALINYADNTSQELSCIHQAVTVPYVSGKVGRGCAPLAATDRSACRQVITTHHTTRPCPQELCQDPQRLQEWAGFSYSSFLPLRGLTGDREI